MAIVQDHILRIISPELNLRGACVSSSAVCEEARRRHATSPLATVALGRVLSAALLMGSSLKGAQKVGLQYRGSGPLREIYADSDGTGQVRGYVMHPEVDLPMVEGRFNVGAGLGVGTLNVTTDLGIRDTYQGIVPLVNGEIAMDLANYFATSVQIPTAVNLGVWINEDGTVGAAGGFVVQALPGADEAALAELEGNVLGLPPLSGMVHEGFGPRQILEQVFRGYAFEILTSEPVFYKCTCSREKVERTLIALGAPELTDMMQTTHGATVRCEFCAENYTFSETDLATLLDRAQTS